jgi:hypothetical protein
MLSHSHVARALEEKREAFAAYQVRQARGLSAAATALAWLATLSRSEVEARLERHAQPGARPTSERCADTSLVHPLGVRWASHAEAHTWAAETAHGATILAVDGSQVTPTADFSVPIGAVQVAWFRNPHDSGKPYVKDLRFEILAPDELHADQERGGYPDDWVNLRRFQLECAELVQQLTALAARRERALAFFDGSLVLSFAAHLNDALQRSYVDAILEVLRASEATRIPVVGFVDASQAHDLSAMLALLCEQPELATLADATLLGPHLAWGDRSEAWICSRDDGLFRDHPERDYYHQVAFCYLQTTRSNTPARLDLPRWVLDDGLLDAVVDLVRADCVTGTGYPYALQAADAVAVITAQDRERLYGQMGTFLHDELGLPLRYAAKPQSKRVRR